MPIYEYQCKKCSQEFEVLLRSGDKESSLTCPKCQSKKIKRLMSSFVSNAVKSPGDYLSDYGGGASSSGGSGCASCTSSNCASCGH